LNSKMPEDEDSVQDDEKEYHKEDQNLMQL
jgi:hypothetical protein